MALFSGAESYVLKKWLSSSHDVNDEPLSLIIFKGKPYWENTCVNTFMREIAKVELVTAITGYLERWSIIAKLYLSLGKGPK